MALKVTSGCSMSNAVKVKGQWRNVTGLFVNVDGDWRTIKNGFAQIANESGPNTWNTTYGSYVPPIPVYPEITLTWGFEDGIRNDDNSAFEIGDGFTGIIVSGSPRYTELSTLYAHTGSYSLGAFGGSNIANTFTGAFTTIEPDQTLTGVEVSAWFYSTSTLPGIGVYVGNDAYTFSQNETVSSNTWTKITLTLDATDVENLFSTSSSFFIKLQGNAEWFGYFYIDDVELKLTF